MQLQPNPLYKSAHSPRYETPHKLIQLFKHRGKPISLVGTEIIKGLPLSGMAYLCHRNTKGSVSATLSYHKQGKYS